MPSEIFYWILNMSILGAVTGLIILLIRAIKRIPRRIICILWAIPLIRFLVPFGVSGKYSLMNFISEIANKSVIKTVKVYENVSFTNSVQVAEKYVPFEYKTNLLEDIFSIAFIAWIVIALFLLAALIVVYIISKHEIKNAKHLRDNIYLSGNITSPAVYGIIRAKIILPENYDKSRLNYVLLHETSHIKRKDNFWRTAALFTACIHWFNPLVWIFLHFFICDTESACDEKAIKDLSEEQIKEYSYTLLKTLQKRTIFQSGFTGAKLKSRIENIITYKKLTVFSAVAFAALICICAYVLLTNAVA